MSLRRTMVILGLTLAVMLTVVILRAESTRLEWELGRLERRAAALRQELREQELERARLRNPALIRARVAEMRLRRGSVGYGAAAP